MSSLSPAPLLVLVAVGACSGGNTAGQLANVRKQDPAACLAGSTWDGNRCAPKQVARFECPAETKLDDGKCVVLATTPTAASPVPTSAPAASGSAAASPAPTATSGSCPADMASLGGGTFTMERRRDNISVSVSAFCMDLTEVTVDQYSACVGGRKCKADHPGQTTTDGTTFTRYLECNYGASDRGDHPINCVDWNQAGIFCHAHGKRLPTEEEWEWAARGGSEGRTYPWGNAAPDSQPCWSGISKRSSTCAVGSNPAGDAPGGIHDLAGNVWEWTSSNEIADARVYRGGGWSDHDTRYLRAAFRSGFETKDRFNFLGFRCAKAQ